MVGFVLAVVNIASLIHHHDQIFGLPAVLLVSFMRKGSHSSANVLSAVSMHGTRHLMYMYWFVELGYMSARAVREAFSHSGVH